MFFCFSKSHGTDKKTAQKAVHSETMLTNGVPLTVRRPGGKLDACEDSKKIAFASIFYREYRLSNLVFE